jgi:hypothetical protein
VEARSTSAQNLPALAADPLAIYESTPGRHCFGRGVAARTCSGRTSSHTHSVRSDGRCPPWSGNDGPVGTGTADANDTSRTFDGVRGWNDTSQQGKDSRNGKQHRFHRLSPLSRGLVFRLRSPAGKLHRANESEYKDDYLLREATLGNYSQTNQEQSSVADAGYLPYYCHFVTFLCNEIPCY